MNVKTHKLKISPCYFRAFYHGDKRFEIRKNDRDYKVGDILMLREFSDGHFTGRHCFRVISYIFKPVKKMGLKKGWVILSIN